VLPGVRLHALKDYFGMVALLREPRRCDDVQSRAFAPRQLEALPRTGQDRFSKSDSSRRPI
jgi:hypothetical protein